MNDGEQEQKGSQNRAAPVWNAIALAAPLVGFGCGVVAGVSAPHFHWFEWGFLVWLGFGVAGLLAGVIALVRAERLWGLTVAGLILNAGLVFLLVAWFIDNGAFDRPEPPIMVVPVAPGGVERGAPEIVDQLPDPIGQ